MGPLLVFAFVPFLGIQVAGEEPPTDTNRTGDSGVAAPAAENARSGVRQTRHSELFEASARAGSACSYQAGDDLWRCDAKKLDRFNIRAELEIVAPGSLSVSAAPLYAETASGRCTVAFALEIRHPTDSVRVPWENSSFSSDAVAIQAVPGFARQATENLMQRPSTAIAGTTLSEQVFGIGDNACLQRVEPHAGRSTLILSLPIVIGESPGVVTVTQTHEWASVSEPEALNALKLSDPGPEPEEPGGCIPWRTPVATAVGGLLCGGCMAGVSLPLLTRDGTNPTVWTAIGTCAALGASGGFFAGLAGDFANILEIQNDTIRLQEWRDRKKAVDALGRQKGPVSEKAQQQAF